MEPREGRWTEDSFVRNDPPPVYGMYYIEDDGGVFYVGWGGKNRTLSHLKLNKSSPEYLRLAIEERRARGVEVRHQWLQFGITMRVARTLETAEIMRLGRADLGRGPLLN